MPHPSSSTGANETSVQQLSLFQRFCDSCIAHNICGERFTESACSHPTDYPLGTFHPAAPHVDLKDLLLPQRHRLWSLPFALGNAIVIANEPSTPLPLFGTTLRVAVERSGVRPESSVIAFLLGRDEYLARVWKRRAAFGQELHRKGYSGAVAPAWSNWDDWTPYHALDSISRSACVADMLARVIPTVPSILWRTNHDLTRQADWLSFGDLRVMAVDFGTAPLERLASGLQYLGNHLRSEGRTLPTLLAVGIGSEHRIRAVAGAWHGRTIIASQRPWQLARCGKRLTEELNEIPENAYTTEDLLRINATTLDRVAGHIINCAHQLSDRPRETPA